MPSRLTPSQLDLLLHAGVFGLCRIPAGAVEDVNALREAGLVALNHDRCFELTPHGRHQVAAFGGKATSRHLH
jgi:hypothetical protein